MAGCGERAAPPTAAEPARREAEPSKAAHASAEAKPDAEAPRRDPGTGCDAVALAEAATELADARARWTPATGMVLDLAPQAASAIWQACAVALTPQTRRLLDLLVEHSSSAAALEGRPEPKTPTDPVEALLPGHAYVHGMKLAAPADNPALAELCPDYEATAASLSSYPRAERAGALFDGCKLGAATDPVATREEFVDAEAGTIAVRALAVRQWLRANGAGPADARTLTRELFVIAAGLGVPIVLRLAEGLLLPAAPGGAPLSDGLPVVVGPDDIRAMDWPIIALKDGRPVANLVTDGRIDPLFDVLAEEADKGDELAKRHDETWEGTLVVAAHRDTPWSTVQQVVATAVAAGVSRATLAVLVNAPVSPIRAVVIHDSDHPVAGTAVSDSATVGDAVRIVTAR